MISRTKYFPWISCIILGLAPLCPAAEPGEDVYQQGFLTKEGALQSIQLQDGYRLELVLSEPEIEEPVMAAWDGNDRLKIK